ncbi:MAG TPA: hypothetical protein VHZ77_01065 [Gaiellaceae bacterium]|nr:hypothetical protein [Gaiellaceae bacterium]
MEAGGPFTCSNCGREVPREPFCVCCGEPLAGAGPKRAGYAAAPHEKWFQPGVVSSIFPHLPRADMRSFRLALVGASLVVVVLCLLGLFPLALVAAAVAVPILFLLYLWDVDVYEDAPLVVIAFTVAWGIVFGVALGYAATNVPSHASLLQGGPTSQNVLWLGVILPCAALLFTAAGPLALLPYRKFDDLLDGVTFGACCGATLVAAEAIANSASFLHLGFKPAGNEELWIARLLTLGVATPVLAAGAGAAVVGSFWLRFRAPVADRGALGLPGSPLASVPLAVGALVGAALAALYLGVWVTLAITAALGAAALVWLRRMIHVGLREESDSKPLGPPIDCPSCHHETPAHTFCGHCGIALRALPKDAGPHGEGAPRRARLGIGVKLAAFGALGSAAVAIAAIAIAVSRPAAPKPACEPGVPCGAPPPGIPVAAPHLVAGVFRSGSTWTSNLGVTLRYGDNWKVEQSGDRSLVIQSTSQGNVFVVVAVVVFPSSMTPAAAIQNRLSNLGDEFLGVEHDSSAAHAVLAPELGFVHATAATYSATVDEPPSPDEQVELAFEAARHGHATVVVVGVTNEEPHSKSASSPFPSFQLVDLLLDDLQWPGS